MADLDAVGNTTKAITKGVAIASAVIAAVILVCFIHHRCRQGAGECLGLSKLWTSIRISDTAVFIGLLLGGALPWLFSSLSIRAVTRAAGLIVEEVRRQFRIPGIMEGTVKPDYARVVGISTGSAQKELIPLATISVLTPLVVGLVLEVEALGGFLAGIILSGQLLAVFMSNAGGAWDNAKKSHRRRAARPGREYGQRLRAAQGRVCRRYGRRSAQGYRWSGAEPDDQGGQPRQPDGCSDHRVSQWVYPLDHSSGFGWRDRLGDPAEQTSYDRIAGGC